MKIIELESLIVKLFSQKNEINLRNIAEEAGLAADTTTDRRAIQRALSNLIKRNTIEAKGQARARVYILKNSSASLFTSDASAELLTYLSKSIRARKPVGYNQNFLRSYQPNKTFYLSSSLREELLSVGKVESIVHPAGTYARSILNRLLIDLSWNSSRLEGNTYSLLETKRLIELGESATGKNAAEAQMILNHKNAIEYIIESSNEKKVSSHEIHSIHALLSENLLGDPSASGKIREISVGISGTTYIPLENSHLLREFFDLYIKKMNQIKDPFEQSFFSLVQLSYMQVFEDVNKRTSRLVANIPLIKHNLKPLSFVDVNQQDYVISLLGIYEKNDVCLLRDLYVWAYKRSSQRYSALQQSLGEPNLYKLKYRTEIQTIIRSIILKQINGKQLVSKIKHRIKALQLSEEDSNRLFQLIEIEIMSLHNGNIAQFKILPSEFDKWKAAQY